MGTMRVLVVDDEPSVCGMIEAVLNSMGVQVQTVSNTVAAETILEQEKFDAVFLDARMPKTDGVQIACNVRAKGFNQNTPLVMISGDTEPGLMSRAFQAGVNYFLFKPIDKQKLQRIVRASQGRVLEAKRRFQRVKVRCTVSAQMNGRRIEGHTDDMSLGGMLVRASDVFPIGSRLRLELALTPPGGPLRAMGCVMRSVEPASMGIRFEALPPSQAEILRGFLQPFLDS